MKCSQLSVSPAVLPLTGRLVIGKIDADQRSMRSNDRIDLYLMTTLLPCEYESVEHLFTTFYFSRHRQTHERMNPHESTSCKDVPYQRALAYFLKFPLYINCSLVAK